MFYLNESKASWNTQDFSDTFKREVSQLDSTNLPLYAAMSVGNHVIDNKLQVTILKQSESPEQIFVKAGVFFSSIISGCACDDDPTPIDENPEYCELVFSINKQTAATTTSLTD